MVKRLLYITNIRFPSERAHATQIVNMCNAFAENGLEVDLVVSNRPSGIDQDAEEYFGQPFKFKVTKFNTINPIHLGKVFYYLSTFITSLKSLSIFREANHDIVYCRDEFMLFVLLPFIDSRKMVWESHLAGYNFFARTLIRKGLKIVAISEGIRDSYKQKGVPETQMLVAHDGIDDSFFAVTCSKADARTKLGLKQDAFIALYIGGFDAWKGIDTFCKAASLTPGVLFAIIGGKKSEIAAYQDKYSTVQFLGMRPYKELPQNQQAADVLVIPNTAKNAVSSEYTSPLKLFAYMASKIPIVASQVPSITNVLSEDNAYFFEPDNPQSLSRVLGEVKENRELAVKKAQETFDLSKRYTWNSRAYLILRFIIV